MQNNFTVATAYNSRNNLDAQNTQLKSFNSEIKAQIQHDSKAGKSKVSRQFIWFDLILNIQYRNTCHDLV